MRKISYLLLIVFFISCNPKKDYTTQEHQQGIHCDSPLVEAEKSNEDYIIQLHLEGIRYDSLFIRCNNMTRTQAFKFSGESTEGSNWKFSIPDSVSRLVPDFFFVPKLKDDMPTVQRRFTFFSCQNGDTLIHYDKITFERNFFDIYIKYSKSQVLENVSMFRTGVEKDGIFKATLYVDWCEISLENGSDFEVRGYYPTFPYIQEYKEGTYDNYITQCIKIIEKYPNSRYLIGRIAENRTMFKKESLQKIYAAFSKENQQSDFGKIIDVHLQHFFVFSNIKLPRYDNRNMEYLIQDSTKMNIIVFSASWCAPCHELIPVLKKIHLDLQNHLIITYVSMDEKTTANNWRKLMKEKAIPWRSLMAEDNIETVRATYNPPGTIPFALLVYPNKNMEIIDIRQSDQKEKLYSICK